MPRSDPPPPAVAGRRHTTTLRWLVIAGFACLAVVGAGWLEALCDDAFITFRYVSNARDGHGLVWNPPPFLPVEGYSSFAWAVLLWAAWSWFGVEPPLAANPMSMACGFLAVVVTGRAAFRLRDRRGNGIATLAVVVALLALVANRTFLRFLTGGLETELFNLLFLGWVLLAFREPTRRSPAWLAGWSGLAAAAAWTRPDGLLLVACTVAVGGTDALTRRLRPTGLAIGLVPLAAVALHVLWRHSFYGEWLPNTYYAKVSTPQPEPGLVYLTCYLFEHGGWLWLPLGLLWSGAELLRARGAVVRVLWAHLPATAAVGTVLAHAAYYTLVVGGDGFEYRVFSHLVPLQTLATLGMAARLSSARMLSTGCACLLLLGNGWGWLHLAATEHRTPPAYDFLAPKVPAWLRPLAHWHDRQRFRLQLQMICLPYPRGIPLEVGLQWFPERVRRPFDLDDVPIAHLSAVGVAGWVLPDIAIVDVLGLNDWVTARTPVPAWQLPFLPREALVALVARADQDGDGGATDAELTAAFAATLGCPADHAAGLAEMLRLLFADRAPDRLTADELAEVLPFFDRLRLLAHERRPPAAYLTDLPANVTFQGRDLTITPRATPLPAARVREVERQWRLRTLASSPR